ncbi:MULTISPECIES: ABC transporter substrate-binding protein [unclassified Caballeronia]|uniref:ABC transporter substrate-binding protein n=1 Tax=unclassified Caballeronia TaxID=2646786 RepID=UPI001F32419A|nr:MULTISPECIES: ABC transporter substrate-binding protein [unclassified Caballeronia]MCE4548173.1 ABC transporter substrate-binding protein [Caballeronia sp. PC1]MCE4575838.1 ABC transporter substrate-binding protein [Caballeronia sp. CLC5]
MKHLATKSLRACFAWITFGIGLPITTFAASPAPEVNCPVKIGGVLPLTGSLGAVGKSIANSAELAVKHINEAGGVKGCPVVFRLKDDQGQPNVGVDAAKYLVDVEHVSALVASVSSGVTVPIATSVTATAKIPQISCCSSSPILTTLAQEGKTGGYFFRTFPTAKTMAYPASQLAAERGYKRIAIIFVNTDYGTSLAKGFIHATEKLGGKVVKSVPYNENQPSYRAEVSSMLNEKPDALFLVAFPQDGATIARDWISLGGTQNLILNNALRSPDFVSAVGAKYLQKAVGIDISAAAGPSVNVLRQAYETAYKASADGPGIYSEYDAMIALGLAMNIAPSLSGSAIRDAMRKVYAAGGTQVGTGPDEFRKALELIKKGAPIQYVGAIGPIRFDAYGDISTPAVSWHIQGTALVVDQAFSSNDMQALFKKIDS